MLMMMQKDARKDDKDHKSNVPWPFLAWIALIVGCMYC